MRRISLFLLCSCLVLVLCTPATCEKSCGFVTQRVQCGDLACDAEAKICIPCRNDADCYPGAMQCNTKNGKCEVRSYFSMFNFRTCLAMIGAFFVCSIGVLAGVGGGGILVPMFCGFMQLPMQTAVGLSQSTICGQSTLNMYLAVQKKFPDESWERPLINYQYLSLMLPLGLIGTLFGGVLSKLCPDVLRLVLLFLLLSAVLYRTVKKMRTQYAKDKAAKQVTVEATEAATYGSAAPGEGTEESKALGSSPAGSPAASPASPPPREPQPQYPQTELIAFFSCFFMLLLFNILRTYCPCGGLLYWMCILVPAVFLSVTFYQSRERLRVFSVEQPERLTFTWNYRNSVTYPMVAVVAGAAAAMLGIGGGLVLGFVLYEIGLIPEEASVTGGMATFFIAFSSALQLLVTGHLAVDYGIVFFFVGMLSTALGQFVFMKKIKEKGWSFLIVGCLAFIVGGSLVVLGGYGIFNAVVSSRNGGSVMAPGRLCTS